LTQKLPWSLILIGAFISILLEVIGAHALPIAVGIYLPFSTSATIFAGGLIRALIERKTDNARQASLSQEETGKGVLLSSGLIAGGAIGGLVVAFSRVGIEWAKGAPGKGEELLGFREQSWITNGDWANVIALIIFAGLVGFVYFIAKQRSANRGDG